MKKLEEDGDDMANDVMKELGFTDGVTNSAYKNSLT